MRDHVEVYDAQGKRQAVWDRPGPRAVLTSIALGEEDVFVADAGSLVVWRYDPAGKVIGQIGRRDPSRGIAGFVCPSPYFDVALAPDGLLRIANPGVHRVEAYTFDGHQELSWGKAGMAIGEFCGCCGPSHIAILPDGRVVTAEKGIPRVKVYSPVGRVRVRGGRAGHLGAEPYGGHRNLRRAHAKTGGPRRGRPPARAGARSGRQVRADFRAQVEYNECSCSSHAPRGNRRARRSAAMGATSRRRRASLAVRSPDVGAAD